MNSCCIARFPCDSMAVSCLHLLCRYSDVTVNWNKDVIKFLQGSAVTQIVYPVVVNLLWCKSDKDCEDWPTYIIF